MPRGAPRNTLQVWPHAVTNAAARQRYGAKLKVPCHTCYYSFIIRGVFKQPGTIHYPKHLMDLKGGEKEIKKGTWLDSHCVQNELDWFSPEKVLVKGNVKVLSRVYFFPPLFLN